MTVNSINLSTTHVIIIHTMKPAQHNSSLVPAKALAIVQPITIHFETTQIHDFSIRHFLVVTYYSLASIVFSRRRKNPEVFVKI